MKTKKNITPNGITSTDVKRLKEIFTKANNLQLFKIAEELQKEVTRRKGVQE